MSARTSSDRLNPVLLKELRQALRSRAFAVLFPTCLAVATTLAIVSLIDSSGRQDVGRQVFLPVFALLQVAALGLVPFSAFQSMAGEWDESTHDLLVLADLHPLRIVLGKLLTAALESTLYFAAFLPLLLFTFLLRGIDVRDVLFLASLLWIASLSMSALACAAAGLTRLRVWRVIMLAALALVGLGAYIAGIELADEFVWRGRGLGASWGWHEALGLVALVAGVGAIALAFAATRLAHPEDDRSSLPRLALTAALVALLTWLGFLVHGFSGTNDLDEIGSIVALFASFPAILFVTEAEPLPRRVRARAPRHPLLAAVAAPFLPGGGRGVLLFLVHLALIAIWAVVLDALMRPHYGSDPWWEEGWRHWVAFNAYLVVYLAGGSLLLRSRCQTTTGRIVARIVLPAVAVLSMLVPALVGFVVGNDRWAEMEHGLNPFYVLSRSGSLRTGPVWIAQLAAILALALSLPRLARGVGEVVAAGRARREHAAQAAGVGVHAG